MATETWQDECTLTTGETHCTRPVRRWLGLVLLVSIALGLVLILWLLIATQHAHGVIGRGLI